MSSSLSHRSSRPSSPVAVFGGTGFLGRRIVKYLLMAGCAVRVVSRHPDRAEHDLGHMHPDLEFRRGDIHDAEAISSAVEGADSAINAVSLYVENGPATFWSVHVAGAERLARLCHKQGLRQLVQISGIGADPQSASRYIHARGMGELAVREAFPRSIVVRPAVMFGVDDAFLTTLVSIVRTLPVIPLFGHGRTRLQPAFVEDVGRAVARIISLSETASTYQLVGPETFTYRELVEKVAKEAEVRRLLMPLSFRAWKMLAMVSEYLPWSDLTINQVELMQIDNVASGDAGMEQLGFEPTPLLAILQQLTDKRAEFPAERGKVKH